MPTPTVELTRLYHDEYQTRGIIAYQGHAWRTLELPWRANRRGESCIPPAPGEGAEVYPLRHRAAHESGSNDYAHFHVQDVEDRTYILIERGNLYTQTEGCIFVGRDWIDINGDGIPDVSDSGATLREMRSIIPDHAQLIVRWTLMPKWIQSVVGVPPKRLPTPSIEELLLSGPNDA